MYLGSVNEVIIHVNISSTNNCEFSKKFLINKSSNNRFFFVSIEDVNYTVTNDGVTGNPFSLPNDYVEYFYYPPVLTNDSIKLSFSIIKENQAISAINWNTYSSSRQNISTQIQVPKLTISIWSGLAIQCYLITNNMACTLLLPEKYQDNVQGLAFGDVSGDANQYCMNSM